MRAYERSFYVGAEGVEAARFFRRDVFSSVGGFDLNLDAGEDWDLTIRVRRMGRVARIEAMIDHDEGRVSYFALCRKKAGYAAGTLSFARKHGWQGLRQVTSRPYLRRPWRLAYPHPVLGLGVASLKAGEVIAVVTALIAKRLRLPSGVRTLRVAREKVVVSARVARAFRNWPAVLTTLAIRPAGDSGRDLMARSRLGAVVTVPNRREARYSVIEVFADDSYRLAQMLASIGNRPILALDIGAHVGAFAIRLATESPKALVVCYEPSPAAAVYCRRNVSLSHLTGRIHVVEAAIGANRGSARLYGRSSVDWGNSLYPSPFPSSGATAPTVPVVAFDDAVHETAGRFNLVKLDCEGSEYDIIAKSRAESWAGVQNVLMEYHPVGRRTFTDIADRLARFDLQLQWQHPNPRSPGLGIACFSRTDATR